MNKSKEIANYEALPKVLIAEDEENFKVTLRQLLLKLKITVDEASDGVEAINFVNRKLYDLILLDLGLPRVNGMEVLAHVKEIGNPPPVIVLTGSTDVKSVVGAMKFGAYDYLTKPFNDDELLAVVHRALELRFLRNTVILIERAKDFLGEQIIGKSDVWLSVLDKAKRFSEGESPIYLEGETGSGKEVVAKYIHKCSERKDKPFITVDCGVIPDSLIESELFGHQKGAFTGAEQNKEGLVELANIGTLFLDEIGHIDAIFQKKLLKFVETKTFRRVGDTKTRAVDIRIIVATNKKLAEETNAGRFRSDLWYRLNVMKIEIPPLRDRKSDIIPLAQFFITKYSPPKPEKRLSPAAQAALESYSWPGNVRELKSVIQCSIVLSRGDCIEVKDLGFEPNYCSDSKPNSRVDDYLVPLREAEKHHISNVLTALKWNVSAAAKILQIGRTTLHAKLKEYNLRPPSSTSS